MATILVRVPLADLQDGQTADFFAILCDRQRKITRDGKKFYNCQFRDRRRKVASAIWYDSPLYDICEKTWKVGEHYKLRATYYRDSKYGPRIEVHDIRNVTDDDLFDGYDPEGFDRRTRFDVDDLFDELLRACARMDHRPLARLVEAILLEYEEVLRAIPAAQQNHHAYRGGLLEHMVSVTRTGIFLADKYRAYYTELDPPLNKDLIIAGCMLHDIGKVRELKLGAEGASYTVEGHLIGHILSGRDIVREFAPRIEGLDGELVLLLEHIITSHQGLPEWGSPKVPMIPEALLVHYADDIDAKMGTFVGILNGYDGDEPMTDNNNLLRRRLLKSRKA